MYSSKPKIPNNTAEWDLVEAGSLDTDFSNVIKCMDSNAMTLDVKLRTLDKHVADMNSKIDSINEHLMSLKGLVETERKYRHLERARNLTDLGSFSYYRVGYNSSDSMKSSDLAKKTIGWFMLNRGYSLPDAVVGPPSDKAEDRKKAFREKFKTQIKQLINREPRLSCEDGVWKIYYA